MQPNEEGLLLDIALAAQALLERLDHITTEEFSLGGDHDEREVLRTALFAFILPRDKGETNNHHRGAARVPPLRNN